MIAVLFAAVAGLFPMHGTVVATLPGSQAIVLNDDVPMTLAPSEHRYALQLQPGESIKAGVGIEGLVDTSGTPWRLLDALPAAPFAPGVPDRAHIIVMDYGTPVPHAHLVDQRGAPLDLASAYRGKTLLLSFVFTRCPDRTLCPAISGKYAYLQSHLDPARFALVEITLDPPYDSPRVLQAYGDTYGARPNSWHLLTGTGTVVKRVLDEFGINSLRVSAENFIHTDKLYIITPQGRVATIVETAGWDPSSVIAEAETVDGAQSNPFERFKLSLVADVVALCGGSDSTGVALLETFLFAFLFVATMGSLYWIGRRIWAHKA
jgi:protein SCO1/2